jgi:hypothetical protein
MMSTSLRAITAAARSGARLGPNWSSGGIDTATGWPAPRPPRVNRGQQL